MMKIIIRPPLDNIKKYLGKEWIKNQEEIILKGAKKSIKLPPEIYVKLCLRVLCEIEKIITKFIKIEGFDKWVVEAKTAKTNFKDLLFELMTLELFIRKSDTFTLKSKRTGEGKEPEACLLKDKKEIFLECTNIDGMPSSIPARVKELFKKSTKKFDGAEGIHIVGALSFFDGGERKENFEKLMKSIEERFLRGYGSKVIAFVLVNVYFQWVPRLNVVKPVRGCYIILNPRKVKKYGVSFLENLIDIKDFKKLER